MRFYLAFAICLTFRLPNAATAQEEWAIPFSLERIEAYYALCWPARLAQGQIVFREVGRYDDPLDGLWGAEMAEAFATATETLIAINAGAELAVVHGPDGVPRVTDWVGSVIFAEGGFADTPD